MSLKADPKYVQPESVIWRPHDQRIQSWIATKSFSHNWFEHMREGTRASPRHQGGDGSRQLESAIHESRWILNLGDDFFDDPKEPRYSEETWLRATRFLRNHIRWAEEEEVEVGIPEILPGESGSIKFHWKSPRYELLLTVPADREKPITFYGDDYGKGVVKLSLGQNEYDFAPLLFLAKK